MTIGGWIIMLVSTLSVTALFAWCIWKVFTADALDESSRGIEPDLPEED